MTWTDRRRRALSTAGWTALFLFGVLGTGVLLALCLAQAAVQAGWWTP